MCLLFLCGCGSATRVAKAPVAPTASSARATTESAKAATPASARVVIVSIDGLRPDDCLRAETLRTLAAQGAFAAPPEGALGVTPTVTYPSHTSMLTGVHPDRHGITTNHAPHPPCEAKHDGGWRWYAEDVRVDSVAGLAFDAGLRTAAIGWPVSVGMRATLLLPEVWRAGTPDDVKLVRALSSPGFLDEIARRHPTFYTGYTPPAVKDDALISAALTALKLVSPDLLLVHLIALDKAQHDYGPSAPEAMAALEESDRQLARLLSALQADEAWSRTVLFVVSDHGFAPLSKHIQPRVALAREGLSSRVWVQTNGGFAYFYLTDTDDAEAEQLARSAFEALARNPNEGLGVLLDRARIAELRGDPDAFLAIEAAPGFAFSRHLSEATIVPATSRGVHGYLPERPEMRGTLLVVGPSIAPSTLTGARLVDIAPTVAALLGLRLGEVDGRVLPPLLR
jgi:predicted AlkP superfamily pyrophosphatase or phosphodiesterase